MAIVERLSDDHVRRTMHVAATAALAGHDVAVICHNMEAADECLAHAGEMFPEPVWRRTRRETFCNLITQKEVRLISASSPWGLLGNSFDVVLSVKGAMC